MTNQEVFDKVVAHARQQGCKSLMENVLHPEEGPICAYRGENNTKCFAVLIPDEDYRKSYEDKFSMAVFHEIGITDMDGFLVRDLQVIHDHTRQIEWEAKFKKLAND